MLLRRILTAVPLIVGLCWVVLAAPVEVFRWLVVIITLLAAREWAALSGIAAPLLQGCYALAAAAAVWFAAGASAVLVHGLALLVLAVWLFALPLLMAYPKYQPVWLGSSMIKLLLGAAVVVGAGASVTVLRGEMAGPWWLMTLFGVIWISDIGAYFVGRRFGRRRLVPSVSPGKTVEGLAGGVALVAVAIAGTLALISVPVGHPVFWFWAGIIVTLFGVVGDLLESWLKREAGVKDSGRLLPGHGGVLDRIDSLCAAAPVAVVLFSVAGAGGVS